MLTGFYWYVGRSFIDVLCLAPQVLSGDKNLCNALSLGQLGHGLKPLGNCLSNPTASEIHARSSEVKALLLGIKSTDLEGARHSSQKPSTPLYGG